jgi:hypothetical protein
VWWQCSNSSARAAVLVCQRVAALLLLVLFALLTPMLVPKCLPIGTADTKCAKHLCSAAVTVCLL